MNSTERAPPGTWRLLFPALVTWSLTAITVAHPGIAIMCVIGAVSLGCAALLALRVPSLRGGQRARRIIGSLLLVCAAISVVEARVVIEERARADPTLHTAADESRSVTMQGRLASFPEYRTSELGERGWLRADVLGQAGDVPVLVWLNDRAPETWAPGTPVVITGIPEVLAAADSAAFAVSARQVQKRPQFPGLREGVGVVAATLRADLRELARRAPGASLVPGFAVGDTSLVSEELEGAMLQSSLTHLTAVSGANCALVTGAVMWVLSFLQCSRRVRIVVAGASLLGFVVLVGPDISVQRAAVMAAVLLISSFGGKRSVSLPSLGVAMLALLIMDPWQSVQPGYGLSVAATAGILLIATPLSSWFGRRLRAPKVLSLPVAVAVAAQFACGPLLLLLQPGIPAVGVLANVVAAPAAPIGTGLGLLATLATPLPGRLAEALVLLASLPARWVDGTARLASSLPAGRWHWPEGETGALLLAGCQLSLVTAWALWRGHLSIPRIGRFPGARVSGRSPWKRSQSAPRVVRLIVSVLSCASLGIFVSFTVAYPIAETLGSARGWAVVACDVGQGDAVLLRDPQRPAEVMLVDTGDDPERLRRCLERFGVKRIELLVLTHDDRDHVGALAAIVNQTDAALISQSVSGESTADRQVVRELTHGGVPYRIAKLGDAFRSSTGGFNWFVIGPNSAPPDESNAASIVMMVDAGPLRILMLGDTGREEQEALVAAARSRNGMSSLSAQVVKVAHHGSRDQDPELPAITDADWALVSVGTGNGYGHPAHETLLAQRHAGAHVLRTDFSGSIALVPAGDGSITPWLEKGSSAHSQETPSARAGAAMLEPWQRRRRSCSSATMRRTRPRSC